jgi:hypothetical protein
MPRLGPIQQPAQSTMNIGAMGQASLRDPPTGHWGYPIIEEEASLIPLQEANRAPEDFPDSTMHSFSEEHLNLLLDIRRDAMDQLFRQENINHRWTFFFIHCQASLLPIAAQFVIILSSSLQLGIIPLLAMEAMILLAYDLPFVHVSVLFFQVS